MIPFDEEEELRYQQGPGPPPQYGPSEDELSDWHAAVIAEAVYSGGYLKEKE